MGERHALHRAESTSVIVAYPGCRPAAGSRRDGDGGGALAAIGPVVGPRVRGDHRVRDDSPPVTAADARRQQVISLQRQGTTPREIAAALPMSRRQVSRLRRALATAEAPFAAANPLPALLLAFVKPNSATGNAKQYMTRQIGVREFEIKQ